MRTPETAFSPSLPRHPGIMLYVEMQKDAPTDTEGGIVHMSLGGHLDELRGRLGKALGGFVVALFASLSAGKWFADGGQ